jgi:hypothetical protein
MQAGSSTPSSIVRPQNNTENAKLLREDSRQLRKLRIHLIDGYLINN